MSFDRTKLPKAAEYFENAGFPLKGSANAKWKTSACPFHGGSDSMRVNVASGGWICMSCDVKGGDVLAFHMQLHKLEFIDAAKALGVWVANSNSKFAARPAPLSSKDALSVLHFESTIVAVAAGNMAHGIRLTETDRARLIVCANRIHRIAEAFV